MVRFIAEKAKRTQGEVLLTGEGIDVTAKLEISGRRQREAIAEIDGCEDGGDLVKTVVAAADHLQTEIQLSWGIDCDPSFARTSAVAQRACHATCRGPKRVSS